MNYNGSGAELVIILKISSPKPTFHKILYPITGAPPLYVGACPLIVMKVLSSRTLFTFVGALGFDATII